MSVGNGEPGSNYLIPHVLFEILLAGDIQANAALAEGIRLDLIAQAWDCRNYDIRDCQTFVEGKLGLVCDVVSIKPLFGGVCVRTFGVFLRRRLD